MPLGDWFSGRIFNFVHGNNLVYNTCWEDPRLDRSSHAIVVFRQCVGDHVGGLQRVGLRAGGTQLVHAVDMNPRQNALLDLKLAAIRNLDYEDFFHTFGEGRLPGVRDIDDRKLRQSLIRLVAESIGIVGSISSTIPVVPSIFVVRPAGSRG